jgi:hypothetical protein
MDERTANEDFIPFVPRRHTAAAHTPSAREDCAGSQSPVQSEEDETADPASDTAGPVDPSEPALGPLGEPASGPSSKTQAENTQADLQVAQEPPAPLAPDCTHASVIRAEAIRLAIVACGRALRHVAVVHPKLVAAFVDDALAAVGNPVGASIHSVRESNDPDLGGVLIDCGESQIGADLTTHCELLVRAAADA